LSRRLWPALAAEVQAESGIDPEYRETGCLLPAFDDDEASALQRAIRVGHVEDGRLLQGAELRDAEPILGPAIIAAAWKPGGNVENRRLCKALELADRAAGVEIRTGAEARSIRVTGGRVAGVDLVDEFVPAELVV